MLRKRTNRLMMMVLLVAMVLGGVLTAPGVAWADCIDNCISAAQQCRSWCAPEDWSCLGGCDTQQDRCISYCSP